MLETLADRVTEDFIISLLWDRKTDQSEIHLTNDSGSWKIENLDRENAARIFRHPWTIDMKMISTNSR